MGQDGDRGAEGENRGPGDTSRDAHDGADRSRGPDASSGRPYARRIADRWIAPFSGFWNFIDNRGIDLHAVMAVTLWLTVKSALWAYAFANLHPADGGTVLAAVLGPMGLMQAAMFGFYANARK